VARFLTDGIPTAVDDSLATCVATVVLEEGFRCRYNGTEPESLAEDDDDIEQQAYDAGVVRGEGRDEGFCKCVVGSGPTLGFVDFVDFVVMIGLFLASSSLSLHLSLSLWWDSLTVS